MINLDRAAELWEMRAKQFAMALRGRPTANLMGSREVFADAAAKYAGLAREYRDVAVSRLEIHRGGLNMDEIILQILEGVAEDVFARGFRGEATGPQLIAAFRFKQSLRRQRAS